MAEASYSEARANFAALLDRAAHDRETVIIRRRGQPDVAMIAADELSSLEETVYLLRSPANAERLLRALEQSRHNEGTRMSMAELRKMVGCDDE